MEGIKLTGLWKGKSKNGETYLSGKVSPTSRLLVFPNTHKKSEKDPDYIAYLAPGQEEEQARTRKPAQEDLF